MLNFETLPIETRKFTLRGPQSLFASLGLFPKPHTYLVDNGSLLAWMAPTEWLWMEEQALAVDELPDTLLESAVEVTDQFRTMRIRGDMEHIRAVLQKLTPLDMSSRSFSEPVAGISGEVRRTHLFEVNVTLLLSGRDEMTILYRRSYHDSLRRLLEQACRGRKELACI